jgi:hypothetical protein
MSEPDRTVRWETADYVYEPKGLLADPWGKTGPRTEVSEAIRNGRLSFRRTMDNDESRDAAEYVWSLDDATVVAGGSYGSPEHREICRRLEPVNYYWVTSRCAQDAYERGLIGEDELDRLMAD